MSNRKLPLICASNGDYDRFFTEPCQGRGCHFWDNQKSACAAGQDSAELFAQWFTPERDARMPACPISTTCAWNVAALKAGDPGCFVRRLGLLCEHQGGDWNTFNMTDPDDPVWGLDELLVDDSDDSTSREV